MEDSNGRIRNVKGDALCYVNKTAVLYEIKTSIYKVYSKHRPIILYDNQTHSSTLV